MLSPNSHPADYSIDRERQEEDEGKNEPLTSSGFGDRLKTSTQAATKTRTPLFLIPTIYYHMNQHHILSFQSIMSTKSTFIADDRLYVLTKLFGRDLSIVFNCFHKADFKFSVIHVLTYIKKTVIQLVNAEQEREDDTHNCKSAQHTQA